MIMNNTLKRRNKVTI